MNGLDIIKKCVFPPFSFIPFYPAFDGAEPSFSNFEIRYGSRHLATFSYYEESAVIVLRYKKDGATFHLSDPTCFYKINKTLLEWSYGERQND